MLLENHSRNSWGDDAQTRKLIRIFYSGIKYTEKDWVQHKERHYPLQSVELSIFKVWRDKTTPTLYFSYSLSLIHYSLACFNYVWK